MGKLHFRFGVVNSNLTATALMFRHTYTQKKMNALVFKPAIDTKHGKDGVVEEMGISSPCIDFKIDDNLISLFEKEKELQKIHVVIVVESQFCTKAQIEQLREISEEVSVYAYGLMTNFKTELFEGSKRLLEISDSIQEIKSDCFCGKKATMNGRFIDNVMEIEGSEIVIGDEEKYRAMCYSCFKKEQRKARVYNKILKYLKIFENKTTAGTWFIPKRMQVNKIDPYVIYDEEVTAFINEFKGFEIKNPEQLIVVSDNLEDLKKIKMLDQSFDYVMTLISYVLELEKHKAGLLKALIEDGSLFRWLKQIKRAIDHEE